MGSHVLGLEGKTIIVIGGGQGMGEATSKLLADVGCNVVVVDRDSERAKRVAADLVDKGVRSLAVTADVLDDTSLIQAIDQGERELGPLDGMATIVGIGHMEAAIEAGIDIWELEQRRNVRYVYVAACELARRLIARGAPGSIACVSSVSGIGAAANHAAYGAAKAGLNHLAKSLACEWAPHGIRFNVVASGGIVTPRAPLKSPAEERAAMDLVPMQRRGSVDEIAKGLVFFLSDMASYVTGQTLAVDGGYTAAPPFDQRGFAKIGSVVGQERG